LTQPSTEPDTFVSRVVAFGRALRDAGLQIDAGRLADTFVGLAAIVPPSPEGIYWALRHTLVSRQEEIEVFDREFAIWFLAAADPGHSTAPNIEPEPRERILRLADASGSDPLEDVDETTAGWSPVEALREKDFALLTEHELASLDGAIAQLATARPKRRSRRVRSARRGTAPDTRRLIRASLGTGGEPLRRSFRRRVQRPRRLVVLCDVSGSMEAYTRPLLLFAHTLLRTGRGVEAFAFGTRLTRLTTQLSRRSADDSLALASESVADWAGGTRIGASLRTFNESWGRQGLSRGAVVVIVSDGWELEDAESVGREMARLSLQAYAVVWVNPLKGRADYEPLAGGMRAAFPYIDRFLAGNSLARLEELASVLAGIERRHATKVISASDGVSPGARWP
jgi:uncharacterized protein with von Willebrand factor type A (vWA) domain